MTPIEFLSKPIDCTKMLILLPTFSALWFVSRRVCTFAEKESELSMGLAGIAVVPMRLFARIMSWGFALFTFALFITIAQLKSSNVALLAVFAGFVVAYVINQVISRYEKRFIQRVN